MLLSQLQCREVRLWFFPCLQFQRREDRIKVPRSRKSVRDIRELHRKDFGVSVYPPGRTCYFIHIQHKGRCTWKTVGDAAVTRLSDAREQARSVMVATRWGTRPQTDRTLFETVAEKVFHRYGRGNWKPRALMVNRYCLKNQPLRWFQRTTVATRPRDGRSNHPDCHMPSGR